jgi:hypothetical protein
MGGMIQRALRHVPNCLAPNLLALALLGLPFSWAAAQTPAPLAEPTSEISASPTIPQPHLAVHAVPMGHHFDRQMPVHEQETIRRKFSFTAGAKPSLEIDNITGSIDVSGGATNEVQLVIDKTIRAESNEELARARTEVTLDITEKPDLVRLYVNGPFRCHCEDNSDGFDFRGDKGYSVKMDFHLEVPRDINLKLKTVNEGNVRVRNISGKFTVRNVNGEIEIQDVAGSGKAYTVNGPVKVTFRENPREDSSFRSVNGDVELHFVRGLSADFRFKTFNGGIYSDFPVTALPVRPVREDRDGSKVILQADQFTGVRVGSGGPEITVENLNGDIRVLENHE